MVYMRFGICRRDIDGFHTAAGFYSRYGGCYNHNIRLDVVFPTVMGGIVMKVVVIKPSKFVGAILKKAFGIK